MRPWWIAVLLITGCDGIALKGTIDGQKVPLRDGYFVQQAAFDWGTTARPTTTTGTGTAPVSDGVVYVVLSTVDDPCDLSVRVENGLRDATSASEAAAAWSAHLPDEFWELTLVLRVEDPADDLSGFVFDGLRSDTQLLDTPDEAIGTLTHHRAAFDEAFWSGEADPADYTTSWFTDGGQLEVKRHQPGEQVSGRFDTEALDATGTEVGDLVIRFDVDRCTAMEPFFFP